MAAPAFPASRRLRATAAGAGQGCHALLLLRLLSFLQQQAAVSQLQAALLALLVREPCHPLQQAALQQGAAQWPAAARPAVLEHAAAAAAARKGNCCPHAAVAGADSAATAAEAAGTTDLQDPEREEPPAWPSAAA